MNTPAVNMHLFAFLNLFRFLRARVSITDARLDVVTYVMVLTTTELHRQTCHCAVDS